MSIRAGIGGVMPFNRRRMGVFHFGGHGKKKINKSLMFKNTDRLKKMKRFSAFFSLLWVLSLITLLVAMCIVVVYPAIVLVLIVITLGLILLNDNMDFFNGAFVEGALNIGLVAIGVFVVSSVLKLLIEKVYTSAEIKELNQNPGENKNYLDVAEAIKKINVYRLVMLVVLVIVGGAIAFVAYSKNASNDLMLGVIVGSAVVALGFLIWTSRRQRAIYQTVEISIDEIKQEKRDARQKSREDKITVQNKNA